MEKIILKTSGIRVKSSTRKPDIDHVTTIVDLLRRGYRVTAQPLHDDGSRLSFSMEKEDTNTIHLTYTKHSRPKPDSRDRPDWTRYLITTIRNMTDCNVIEQGDTNAPDQDPIQRA